MNTQNANVSIKQKIVGHETQQGFLASAIQNKRLPSTLLFVGPNGVGKRKVALSLIQQVLCPQPQLEACGQCPDCKRVSLEQHESLLIVEPDGKQIKMDQARQIIEFMSLKSLSTSRFILIDQFQLINAQASNALLKSLEEPPEGTHFILISQSLSGLLPTVKSRSQIVKFAPLPEEYLKKNHSAEDWVFKAAQGSFQALERFSSPEMEEHRQSAVNFWRAVAEGEFGKLIKLVKDFTADKEDIVLKLTFLQQLLRDSIIYKSHPEMVLHQDLVPLLDQLSEAAEGVQGEYRGVHLLNEWSRLLIQIESDLQRNLDRTLCFENFILVVKSQFSSRGGH